MAGGEDTLDDFTRLAQLAAFRGPDVTALLEEAGRGGELEPARIAEIRTYADLLATLLEQKQPPRLSDLKSHFIALASHELRAPVAVIHGIGVTLNQLGDELRLEEMAKLHLALNEQTEHLAHLVNQLLDLSRLEADAIELRKTEVTVKPVIEAIVRAVAPAHADDIEIAVPDDLRARIDPDAFDRIVSNLVVNALKYGAPPVTIAAEQHDTHFLLVVEDRGDGVGKDFQPRLFERFARADERQKDGSGLGLAIAQAYANAQGGELIYGDAEPQGARFELVLPAPQRGE